MQTIMRIIKNDIEPADCTVAQNAVGAFLFRADFLGGE